MTLIKWSKPNGLNYRNDLYNWPYSIFDDLASNGVGGSASYVPAVNIAEKPQSFHIEVSAPGFKKEDFRVVAEDGALRISGEHKDENKEENKTFNRREFRYGSFSRSFTLPENVKVDGIQAQYENGILMIELPKKVAEQKPAATEIKIS
jgi:HSP20 family protein